MIRMAITKDKKAFIDLWKICFDDSPSFIDWFFENRFFPEYSACVEIDGVIVAAMQSMPLPLWIRGVSLPGSIVVAVCTHPDFRGRHLMKSMFTYYMHRMREKKILAVTYKPENLRTYFSLGHFPTTRTLHFSAVSYQPAASPSVQPAAVNLSGNPAAGVSVRIPLCDSGYKSCMRISAITELSELDLHACFDLYSSIAPSYSGMVDRDEGLFLLKSNDYASDGAKTVLCFDDRLPGIQPRLIGYCFFYDTEDGIYGEEFLATDGAAASRMIRSLRSLPGGKPVHVKIPPDFTGVMDGMSAESTSESIPESVSESISESTPETVPETVSKTVPETVPGSPSDPLLIGFAGGAASLSPQNVMGVTDIAEFIRRLDLSRFESRDVLCRLVIGIEDRIIENNNVSLNLLGEKSSAPPCLVIGIGYLVQVLCGYCAIRDIETNRDDTEQMAVSLTIMDPSQADQVNQVLRHTECFIVDEY